MLSEGEAARRHWYLASLGIVRYVPREQPAHGEDTVASADAADESRHAPGQRHEAVTVASAAAMAATPEPVPERRLRVDLGDAPPVAPAPAAPRASESPAAAELFQCRIGFWQPASRVVVLSAMPPGQRPTPVQITMLANLLKAIGALGEGLPGVDLIDWPPSPGLGLQGGVNLAAARDYLGVFLQAKRRLQHFDTALLMGESAARACGDDETFTAGRQLDLAPSIRAIVTHSLHDMEKTPALKVDTWQAIRFLAG